jgi:hypothetical protein
MLNWLRAELRRPFDEHTCAGAATAGHLAALQHLHSEGCSWNLATIARYAAASGSIEVVEWLRQQQGIEINALVLVEAARAGHIAMCAHLRSIGCDWAPNACTAAAGSDHLDTLRWLRDSGCPWDVTAVCIAAAK